MMLPPPLRAYGSLHQSSRRTARAPRRGGVKRRLCCGEQQPHQTSSVLQQYFETQGLDTIGEWRTLLIVVLLHESLYVHHGSVNSCRTTEEYGNLRFWNVNAQRQQQVSTSQCCSGYVPLLVRIQQQTTEAAGACGAELVAGATQALGGCFRSLCDVE